MKKFDAVIIGAGPAGMMAAIRAAERGREILLIERNKSPGRKLLMSGGERCNLTNICEMENFIAEFSESRDFLRNAFARFFNRELISFFEKNGLRLKTEEDGRIFPESGSSADVLEALKSKLKNTTILYNERVREVIVKGSRIEGILTSSGKKFLTLHVVIATGGLSYPETGSTGDGYNIARKLGHSIVELRPALTPIITKERFIKDWQGISLKDVRLTLFGNNKKIIEISGDIIFTHFGLSGPAVLDISGSIYDVLKLKNRATVAVNLMPGKDIDAILLEKFKASPAKGIKNICRDIIPNKIVKGFLASCAVDEDRKANQVSSEQRRRLIEGLSHLRLAVKGVMPIKNAMVTRGGVDSVFYRHYTLYGQS